MKDEDVIGDPQGSPDGELTDIGLQVIGNIYGTKLKASLRPCYKIEGISKSQLEGQNVTVWARINRAGVIVNSRITKPSKFTAFNRSVRKALLNCSQGPKPPKELQKQIYEDGIEFDFLASQ